jgi:tripartite-type tricarboxylate transporter receptor subunit TctC
VRRFWVWLFAGVSALVQLAPAYGQADWPNRPIHWIVPLPPGGSPDLVARVVADRLQAVLGQPVIVENKPGASGLIATEYVARQPADGYTLLFLTNTHVMNVGFFKKLPYDPIKDFEPVSLLATVPFVMTVNSNLPVHSVKEFIEYARANPGKVTYGSAGIGQPHHLAAELLKADTGIEMTHVPYKGSSAIVPALLAGEITMTIGAINSLLPHIREGKLRPLGIAANRRTALLPDVPTIEEAGPLPGFDVDVWLGAAAPAGTPRAIIDRLNTEMNRIVRDPAIIKDKLTPNGVEAVGTTPEQLMEVIKADIPRYEKIAQQAHIVPE